MSMMVATGIVHESTHFKTFVIFNRILITGHGGSSSKGFVLSRYPEWIFS
jgi:hypothetical protein